MRSRPASRWMVHVFRPQPPIPRFIVCGVLFVVLNGSDVDAADRSEICKIVCSIGRSSVLVLHMSLRVLKRPSLLPKERGGESWGGALPAGLLFVQHSTQSRENLTCIYGS